MTQLSSEPGANREQDTNELRSLAERCEQATGPDRELLLTVFTALNGATVFSVQYGSGVLGKNTDIAVRKQCDRFLRLLDAEAWLDAAMTLVPEGYLFITRTLWDGDKQAGFATVSRYEEGEFGGHKRRYWMDEHQANASTPVLALCAAALRARAA